MSLGHFQRALSEMTLFPRLAAEVRRRGAPALSAFDLTAREQARLAAVARQPGMDLNCTLARGNRFGPIADIFPLTCLVLKPSLRELLDELWRVHRPDNYQLAGEEDAFAGILEAKLARGEISHPYLEEIFRYECASRTLVQSLRHTEDALEGGAEPYRQVHFRHDPRALLPTLEKGDVPPPDLPIGDYPVRITLRGDTLHVEFDHA